MAAKLFGGGGRGRAPTISASGTEFPIFLLDGSHFVFSVTPSSLAGGACVAVREKLGLEMDHDYGLFEFANGSFEFIPDDKPLDRVVRNWTVEEFEKCRRRVYFKRRFFIAEGPSDKAESEASEVSDAYHRLAFGEATFHFLECCYRFPREEAMKQAALLLHARRGKFDEERDTLAVIESLADDVVPAYLLSDGAERDEASGGGADVEGGGEGEDEATKDVHKAKLGAGAGAGWAFGCTTVWRRVGRTVKEAVKKSEAAAELLKAYRDLGDMSQLAAEKAFVDASKDFIAHGSDFFVGKRTWKEADTVATEAQVKSRTEDVTVAVGFEGIHLTGMTEPLALESHEYDIITKWTLSRDQKVFAFQVAEERHKFIVYIVTDHAPEIEKSVERYVHELVEVHSNPGQAKEPRVPPTSPGAVPSLQRAVEAARPTCAPEGELHFGEGSGAAAGGGGGGGGDELPPGWRAETDDDGDVYYINDETGETQWDRPVVAPTPSGDLPPGWRAETDDDGDVYYVNDETGETQWDRPSALVAADGGAAVADVGAEPATEDSPLPPGWRAETDDDGDVYYVNDETGETQWDRPVAAEAAEDELPPGWRAETDDDGDVYYVNDDTGETQWDRPTA